MTQSISVPGKNSSELAERLHSLHKGILPLDLAPDANAADFERALRAVLPVDPYTLDLHAGTEEILFSLSDGGQPVLVGSVSPLLALLVTAARGVGVFINGVRATVGPRSAGPLLLGLAPGVPTDMLSRLHPLGSLSFCSSAIARTLVLQGALDGAVEPEVDPPRSAIYSLLAAECGASTGASSGASALRFFGKRDAAQRLEQCLKG